MFANQNQHFTIQTLHFINKKIFTYTFINQNQHFTIQTLHFNNKNIQTLHSNL